MAFELTSPRLLLRKLKLEDSDAMFAYRSDPEVSRYQNWEAGSLEEVVAFIDEQSVIQPNIPGTWFQLAITLKHDNILVGDCGLHFPADVHQQVEIGITLSPLFQGMGYASETLKTIMGFVFDTLGKHRLYGSADGRNKASLALMERIGMRREAYFRQSYWAKGEWTDDVVYAILATEWKESKQSKQSKDRNPAL
jgi:RimJ/RimL family protein N-acetyltransferase